MRGYKCLRLISSKVSSRSYNYFLKFLFFIFWDKMISQTMSKTAYSYKKCAKNFRDYIACQVADCYLLQLIAISQIRGQ
jgi:hypothetical protein